MPQDLEEKYYESLDREEKELLDAYNRGEFKSVPNLEEEKQKLVAAARATLIKKRNINIRISERDLHALKVRAQEKGLPYQTLVSSVLHQYSTGKMKELA
ncbi:MAG: antitoxin [Parcubacteria group bacterium]|nr:antitoxin [Parcubacteria group bacterium]